MNQQTLDEVKDQQGFVNGVSKKKAYRAPADIMVKHFQEFEAKKGRRQTNYAPLGLLANFQEAKASTAAMNNMMKDVNDLDGPSVVDANHMVYDMILRETIREKTAERANQCSTDIDDMQLETQPADVFQRMWTLVDKGNPIWKEYCALINKHTTSCGSGRRQASACSNCMTIFYPHFPDDFHLHRKSEGFKKAIDARLTKSNTVAVLVADDEETQLREGTTYKALISLAKEANAYKSQLETEGVTKEYIKMVRFVKGVRMVAGGSKYPSVELCERCEVEGDIQEAAKQKYKVKALADGISQLILR